MRRRLRQTFANETVFTVIVTCFGLLPVAVLLVALFVR